MPNSPQADERFCFFLQKEALLFFFVKKNQKIFVPFGSAGEPHA
jgi:hypothetical protein